MVGSHLIELAVIHLTKNLDLPITMLPHAQRQFGKELSRTRPGITPTLTMVQKIPLLFRFLKDKVPFCLGKLIPHSNRYSTKLDDVRPRLQDANAPFLSLSSLFLSLPSVSPLWVKREQLRIRCKKQKSSLFIDRQT